MSVFVHAQETMMELREAANKTGSSDLYDKLCERCNSEISKLFLGNTLTTEASDKGTQALGTVHKDVEEKVTLADRQDILDVLNYNMTDIFAMLGIDTTGGEFCYPEKKVIEPEKKMSILTQLRTNFGLAGGRRLSVRGIRDREAGRLQRTEKTAGSRSGRNTEGERESGNHRGTGG